MLLGVDGEAQPASTPQVLLCLDGSVEVTSSAGSVDLTAGAAVFVGGSEGGSP